jgi:ABC-type cobalamin/Fe3+-siderophores transport system ATPase subunit
MSSDLVPPGAIELRSVGKRFIAGAGSCSASVAALRNASVEIRPGEVAVIAGPIGSGKTTLLLCIAGLLRCDSGEIFGVARRVIYRDLALPARPIETPIRGSVLLLDSCDDLPDLARARATRVVAAALGAGAAVVLAARDAAACIALIPGAVTLSVIHLRLGETAPAQRLPYVTRVAEGSGAY